MHEYDDEFPLLHNLGLYAAKTLGDGNCLFNALSDQLYGTQDHHFAIRSAVIQYLRAHKDDLKHFMAVGSGGSTRRNPRRKAAAAFEDHGLPSAQDVDRAFDQHLQRMAQGGTWGDNMEIVAFSKVYKVTVRVYRQDMAMMFRGGAEDADILHIAYHEWEHYSSIRNIDGPHSGKPFVKPLILSPEEEAQQKARAKQSLVLNESVIKALDASTGGLLSRDVLVNALQQARGDDNLAYEYLMNESSQPSQQDTTSRSSVPPSSRANDSSSDGSRAPIKRQDRRLSKAAKTKKRSAQIEAGLGRFPDDSLESLQSSMINLSSPQRSDTVVLHDVAYDPNASDTESEDWKPPALQDGDTSSGSEYSSQGQKITIRLNHTNNNPPAKRAGTARDKSLKKQAQKQAARARRQAKARLASPAPSAMSTSQASSMSNHPGNVHGGIRTLSI